MKTGRFGISVISFLVIFSCGSPRDLQFSDTSNSGASALQKPVLGERSYVGSLLTNVFSVGAPAAVQTSVASAIAAFVTPNPGIFGGPCSIYDQGGVADCNGDDENALASVSPSTSPARQALIAQTCETILDLDAQVSFLQSQLGGGAIDLTKIQALYGRFYLEQTIPPDFAQNLLSVASTASPDLTSIAAWRYVSLAICYSPDWQAL